MAEHQDSYWHAIYKQFHKRLLSRSALFVVLIFCIVGIYAPFFASSKPFIIEYNGKWYFPFFRYLFFSGFYTKKLDIFFNILMFTLPLFLLTLVMFKNKVLRFFSLLLLATAQLSFFIYFGFFGIMDPASDVKLSQIRHKEVQRQLKLRNEDALFPTPRRQNFYFDLAFMNDYAKLNQLLRYQQGQRQNQKIENTLKKFFPKESEKPATLWEIEQGRIHEQIIALEKTLQSKQKAYLLAFSRLELYLEACQSLKVFNSKLDCTSLKDVPEPEKKILQKNKEEIAAYWALKEKLSFYKQKSKWLENQIQKIGFEIMPMIPFHWEDDAGGDRAINQYLPWWQLTRINGKNLMAALIFGIRISLVVGFLAVFLALLIGVPIGSLAGFYGGTFDIVVSRMLEIWESMPTFFMLLLVIAMTQSKSIFLVIGVIGLFGWTTFSRFTRGEFFKQRNLSYVEAAQCLGFKNSHIMFKDILPNAIAPLLTLLPFAIMAAITSEAGLSFLGLGEEGSCSWGVLMDEGRTAFPAEAYLLWPPAIFLTILLVAIALVGDGLRDALDPKLKT